VISLFAGCGGSSLGYSMAGYRELFACEWKAKPATTLQANFPHVLVHCGDITTLSVAQIRQQTGLARGELDVLDGSPPCQGFSLIGTRQLHDARNTLFENYVRILAGLAPRAFVMENVPGMVSGKMRLLFAPMMHALRNEGYHCAAWKLNAMYYGVPQSRERVIILGVRQDVARQAPDAPLPRTRPVSAAAAVMIPPGTLGYVLAGQKGRAVKGISKLRPVHLPAPTMVHDGNFRMIIPWTRVPLTAAEYTRFGSFPDGFRWHSVIHQGVGNSVPPLFMRAIAEHLRLLLVSHADAAQGHRET
jgi:DNA (cytosine-5)-methyltransferase 1